MRIVVDMNLTPRWCEVLRRAGHEAVHWLELGDPRTPDAVIMAWAAANNAVVFTHDLDFGDILFQERLAAPSVIQVRAPHNRPEGIEHIVLGALVQFRSELETGAIVVIEPARARAHLLPLRP